jgi:hypothetical protein
MRRRKGANIIAFPLSRSEQIAPRQKLFKIVDGRIVAAPVVSAMTIDLQKAADRIRARRSTKTGPSSASADFI